MVSQEYLTRMSLTPSEDDEAPTDEAYSDVKCTRKDVHVVRHHIMWHDQTCVTRLSNTAMLECFRDCSSHLEGRYWLHALD